MELILFYEIFRTTQLSWSSSLKLSLVAKVIHNYYSFSSPVGF